MTDQNTFMETLRNVADIVRTSAEPMSEQEILYYFADMDLDESQKRLVLEYLNNPENLVPQEEQQDEVEETADEDGETRSKVFDLYLEELSMLPKYSEEEQIGFYQKLLQGDEKAIEPISMMWLENVLKVAEKYMEPKLNVEDLVQEGNMALFLKLQELCGCGSEADMEECLTAAIEEGIMLYASEMNSEKEQENSLVGKISLVHEATKLLTEENGQVPSREELSEYTKMTIEELKEIEDLLKE